MTAQAKLSSTVANMSGHHVEEDCGSETPPGLVGGRRRWTVTGVLPRLRLTRASQAPEGRLAVPDTGAAVASRGLSIADAARLPAPTRSDRRDRCIWKSSVSPARMLGRGEPGELNRSTVGKSKISAGDGEGRPRAFPLLS